MAAKSIAKTKLAAVPAAVEKDQSAKGPPNLATRELMGKTIRGVCDELRAIRHVVDDAIGSFDNETDHIFILIMAICERAHLTLDQIQCRLAPDAKQGWVEGDFNIADELDRMEAANG